MSSRSLQQCASRQVAVHATHHMVSMTAGCRMRRHRHWWTSSSRASTQILLAALRVGNWSACWPRSPAPTPMPATAHRRAHAALWAKHAGRPLLKFWHVRLGETHVMQDRSARLRRSLSLLSHDGEHGRKAPLRRSMASGPMRSRWGLQDDSGELDPPHACAWRLASLVFDKDQRQATLAVGGVTHGLSVVLYKGLVSELRVRPCAPCIRRRTLVLVCRLMSMQASRSFGVRRNLLSFHVIHTGATQHGCVP